MEVSSWFTKINIPIRGEAVCAECKVQCLPPYGKSGRDVFNKKCICLMSRLSGIENNFHFGFYCHTGNPNNSFSFCETTTETINYQPNQLKTKKLAYGIV